MQGNSEVKEVGAAAFCRFLSHRTGKSVSFKTAFGINRYAMMKKRPRDEARRMDMSRRNSWPRTVNLCWTPLRR